MQARLHASQTMLQGGMNKKKEKYSKKALKAHRYEKIFSHFV